MSRIVLCPLFDNTASLSLTSAISSSFCRPWQICGDDWFMTGSKLKAREVAESENFIRGIWVCTLKFE